MNSNYEISFSTGFTKAYKRLSKNEQNLVKRKIVQLSKNPWHPSLRLKKIKSTDDIFECSINMDIRMALAIEGNRIIILLDIDHHDKLLKRQVRRKRP